MVDRDPIVAAETRSFVPEAATITPSTFAAEETLIAPPIGRTASARVTGNTGASPAVIAGALAAVALLGVGGWYVMSPHDGVPELTPGQPSQVATAPILPAAQPSEVDTATNTLPQRARAPAQPRRMAAATPRVRTAARTAAASAEANSANVSATLPDAPRPYANPANPPAQVIPAAPAPVEAAPAIPATPPVQTAEPAPAPAETTPPTR